MTGQTVTAELCKREVFWCLPDNCHLSQMSGFQPGRLWLQMEAALRNSQHFSFFLSFFFYLHECCIAFMHSYSFLNVMVWLWPLLLDFVDTRFTREAIIVKENKAEKLLLGFSNVTLASCEEANETGSRSSRLQRHINADWNPEGPLVSGVGGGGSGWWAVFTEPYRQLNKVTSWCLCQLRYFMNTTSLNASFYTDSVKDVLVMSHISGIIWSVLEENALSSVLR